MLKIILKVIGICLLLLLTTLPLQAKTLTCAVPQNMFSLLTPIFEEEIDYTKMSIILKAYKSNKKALQALKEPPVKCAVVRADVLLRLQEEKFKWGKIKDGYITIGTLPYVSRLYLVQAEDAYDIDLDSLNAKRVSIGSLGEGNAYLLKDLLHLNNLDYAIQYKGIPYKKSLLDISKGKLDAYFGFLPPSLENSHFHFQTTFSTEVTGYLEQQIAFGVNYNGTKVPYVLVVDKNASDEEIENIIYRLEEKQMFSPQTDERYGTVNRYVIQHLEQIQLALNTQKVSTPTQTYTPRVSSEQCLTYHYGFLDLLRRKPPLKKKLRIIKRKKPSRYKKAKEYLRQIETVLLNIDAKKHTCDKEILREKTKRFKGIEKNVRALAR